MEDLLEVLGYADSPNFLHGEELDFAGARGHVFRQAREACALRGVYALRPDEQAGRHTHLLPLVYVCEASSDEDATRIHRLVWNQDVVPFLIVRTPRLIRLYTGFRYQPGARYQATGLLAPDIGFQDVASVLGELRATAIDQGLVWDRWGQEITPRTRVDWRLLENLDRLGARLREDGMARGDANALIGKYVYLQYLRHRQILSDRKLGEWGIQPEHVFSRRATLKAFHALCDRLHVWLNGSVFPLPPSLRSSLTRTHLQVVAGVFAGDEPLAQLHLRFDAYDFSFIPIETLSVIYEQFLHAQGETQGGPSARERGAYYTPIPLVDFIIDRMETRQPLEQGMRVLDPSCGSGAFLVQCYRRLVERALRERGGKRLRPTELRDLLTSSIFGVDSDHDACQVAELSLILTLLDYVDPPDLGNTSFKLPGLRDRNLFCDDAFNDAEPWADSDRAGGYDWVIGNPPWNKIDTRTLREAHPHLAAWLERNGKEMPIGNQMAEAFAWRACQLAADGGLVGFLMPAMTLFKHTSRGFREALFRRVDLFHVANFANLAEVLFAGRSRVPAAAMLHAVPRAGTLDGKRTVLVYTPFLANQEANRPRRANTRVPTWSFVVNASELRELPHREIASGDSMPWKLAMWGSPMDGRLLRAIARKALPALGALESSGRLVMSQGLELRAAGASGDDVEHHPELADRPRLRMPALQRLRDLFVFPPHTFDIVAADETHVRKGRYELPVRVCEPPHVVVSAARTFAVYSNEFLIVPARQIGIAGERGDESFLKALSLYLSADFVYYHQLLTSTMLGIKQPRATLQSLRDLPVPMADASEGELQPWVSLHEQLARASSAVFASQSGDALFAARGPSIDIRPLRDHLNRLVYDALGIDHRGQALVHDLVHVKMALDDGKLGTPAVRSPAHEEIREYATILRNELDDFLSEQDDVTHEVTVMTDGTSGIIDIALVWSEDRAPKVRILNAGERAARELAAIRERLLDQHSQWVYYRRDLRIYESERVYLFKPMQRLHWTRSQALLDAGEIIAETSARQAEDGVTGPCTAQPARAHRPRVPPARSSIARARIPATRRGQL